MAADFAAAADLMKTIGEMITSARSPGLLLVACLPAWEESGPKARPTDRPTEELLLRKTREGGRPILRFGDSESAVV